MPLPTATLPKLRKLIPLLASDKGGEVIATAAAIGRALEMAAATWHDLAAQLTEPEREPSPRRSRRAPTPDAGTMFDALLDHPRLTEWEFEFVKSIHDQYRRRRRLSDKQIDVLTRIWRKLEGRAA